MLTPKCGEGGVVHTRKQSAKTDYAEKVGNGEKGVKFTSGRPGFGGVQATRWPPTKSGPSVDGHLIATDLAGARATIKSGCPPSPGVALNLFISLQSLPISFGHIRAAFSACNHPQPVQIQHACRVRHPWICPFCL